MYRIDYKFTAQYGDVNPDTGEPEITVTRDSDHPGVYIYEWVTHFGQLDSDEVNGTLTENLNGISTFEFVVYHGSNTYNDFHAARTAVRLWSDKEQAYVFSGRVNSVVEDMDAEGLIYKTVYCENEFSYFCDSICDTKEVEERLAANNRSMNVRDVAITMLELHHINADGINIAASLKKGFMPPNSTFDETTGTYTYPSNVYPTTAITDAFNGDVDTTWALISDIFIDRLGLDMWITYDDSVVPEGGDATWVFGYNVLHIAAGGTAGSIGDPITISTNMQSLRVEASPTSNGRVTRIVPLGGIGSNGKRLDVTSIPQYHQGWTDPSYEKAVPNEVLELTYGRVDKVSLHEDLVDNGNKTPAEVTAMIQELYRRGRAEADALSGGITSITVQAVDLYQAGYSGSNKFRVGDYHHISNSLIGLDDNFRLIRKVTNLAEPWNPQLEFAQRQTSSTTISASKQNSTSNRIYNVENMLTSRLDKSAVKITSAAEYAAMLVRNASTLYYADQGDGTWKAYMGDEPIVMSEGGGDWTVESAAILNSGNILNFLINRQLMANISAETKLYYGGKPAFIVLQGHLCLFANANIADHMIDGDTAILDAIADNAEYFGSRYGDLTDIWHANGKDNGFFAYSANNIFVYAHSITITSVGLTTSNSAMNESVTIVYSYGYDTTQPTGQYVTPTTVTPLVTKGWAFSPARALSYYSNGTWTGDIPETASDLLLVPFVTGISASSYANRPTPYGYATRLGYIIVYRIDGKWYVHEAATRITVGANSYIFPFTSEAELHFALGVAQRSEPVEVTP